LEKKKRRRKTQGEEDEAFETQGVSAVKEFSSCAGVGFMIYGVWFRV